MPKKRETMKDLRELGSLAEFKKMGTDSDFNSILQKTETQTTINKIIRTIQFLNM